MKRVRGKQHLEINLDPETGELRVLRNATETDVLSGEGLDSTHAEQVFFSDCGCRAPAAGRCEICRALSCPACHGRCQRCKIPICLPHSVFVHGPDGGQWRLCKRCYDQGRRRKRLISTARAILSPFVQVDKPHEAR